MYESSTAQYSTVQPLHSSAAHALTHLLLVNGTQCNGHGGLLVTHAVIVLHQKHGLGARVLRHLLSRYTSEHSIAQHSGYTSEHSTAQHSRYTSEHSAAVTQHQTSRLTIFATGESISENTRITRYPHCTAMAAKLAPVENGSTMTTEPITGGCGHMTE